MATNKNKNKNKNRQSLQLGSDLESLHEIGSIPY